MIKYYYAVYMGWCTEKCNLRIGLMIGSVTCKMCENNLDYSDSEGYIVCSELKNAV